MKKTPTVTLNEADQALAQRLARSRTHANRHGGVLNQRMGPQSDAEIDLEGMAAEIAFCRYAKVQPDLSIQPRSGGCDCVIHGRRIDVKTTTFVTGRLIAVISKSISDVDAYVLLVGEFPTYRIIGWAWAKDLCHPSRISDLGHGPTYSLDQKDLHDIEKLLAPLMFKEVSLFG